MLVRIAFVSLCAAAATSMVACGGGAQKTRTLLLEDVRGYNDGVRWRKHPQAATRIAPAERADFLEEREELEDELRIADYEIKGLEYDKSRDHATVRIKWTWHLDSRGVVHKTTSEQKWQRRGMVWLMVEEVRLRGEPMPGVPEPPDNPPDEPKAAPPPRKNSVSAFAVP